MFKKLVAVFAALMLAVLALVPMTAAGAENSTMYVSASNGLSVNVRNAPDKSGRSLMRLGVGFPVSVKSFDTGWYEVTAKVNGRNVHGYINSDFLSGSNPTGKAQKFKSVNAFTVTVRPSNSNGYVNLRAAGTKKSASLRQMYSGEQLTVTAASNAWYRVTDGDGNTGYVAKAYVKK